MKQRINITLNKELVKELKKYNKYGLPFSRQLEILIINFLDAQKKKQSKQEYNKKVDYKNGVYFVDDNNNFEYDPTLDD